MTLNGDALDPGRGLRGLPDRAAGPARRAATCCGSSRTARTPTPVRACTASSTRSTSRPTSTPSSRCRTPAGCSRRFEQPDLKATFQFTVKAPTGWTVDLQLPDARAQGRRLGVRADAADLDVHHRADRRPVPRGAQRVREGRRSRCRSASTAGPRWPSTSTRTRSSRSPGRASTGSRRSSTTRTRSRSTTSCSCRSSTRARWRTRARSPSATSTSSAPR